MEVRTSKFVVAAAGDFYGIYEDGDCISQDNSYDLFDIAKLLGWKIIHLDGDAEEKVLEESSFPDKLKDLKR